MGPDPARLRTLLLLAFLLAASGVALLPVADAGHCGSNVLVEAVVACVYTCGSFYPGGVAVASYCAVNNGRCPGFIDRSPDVPPYVYFCERTGTQTCNPPPALLRLEVCNQV